MSPRNFGNKGVEGGLMPPHPWSVRIVPDALAALVMRYIQAWAWIESLEIRIGMAMAPLEPIFAYETLNAVRRPARIDAIRSVAKELRPNEYELLDWVLKQMDPWEAHRNKLVHWLWLPARSKPDEIPVLDPRHKASSVAASATLKWEKITTLGVEGRQAHFDEPTGKRLWYWERALVYDAKEMVALNEGILTAYGLMWDLETVMSGKDRDHEERDLLTAIQWTTGGTVVEARERLSKARQAWLVSLPPSPQSSPQPQPKSPRAKRPRQS